MVARHKLTRLDQNLIAMLKEFLNLSKKLSKSHIIPRFKILPMMAPRVKENDLEAPFIREVRKGLEVWLREIVTLFEGSNRSQGTPFSFFCTHTREIFD